jgi:hypothetical protein
MAAQNGRFSRVALIRVLPDRGGSSAVCEGLLSGITTPKSGPWSPLTPQSSTVVAQHERGELDGAKEADGG